MKQHGLLGFVSLSFALYAAAAVYAGPKATRPAPVSEEAAAAEKPATPYAQLKTLAPAVRKPLTSIYEFEKYFQNAPVHPKQSAPAAWKAMDKAAQTQANAKWVASVKKNCDPSIFANKAFDWSILSLKSKARPTRDPRTKAFVLHTTFSTRIYKTQGCYITLAPPVGLAWNNPHLLGKPVRVNGTIQSVRIEHRLVKGKFVPHLTLGTQATFITPATGPDAKRDPKTGIPLNSKYVPKPKKAAGNKTSGVLIGRESKYDVIYLVDRNGSMLDSLDYVRNDLYKSIGKLNSSQQFRVIFFSNDKGITRIPTEGGFFKVTRESKLATKKELWKIMAMGRTDPLPAIREAFSGMTDGKKYHLFLITDSLFPNNKKILQLLAEKNKDKRVHVKTFLYGEKAPDAKTTRYMMKIAKTYGGKYQYIVTK